MHIIAPFFEVESLKMSIIGIGKSASECADVVRSEKKSIDGVFLVNGFSLPQPPSAPGG